MADHVSPIAAGLRFHACPSIFPAIAAGLLIRGLLTDATSLGSSCRPRKLQNLKGWNELRRRAFTNRRH